MIEVRSEILVKTKAEKTRINFQHPTLL